MEEVSALQEIRLEPSVVTQPRAQVLELDLEQLGRQ